MWAKIVFYEVYQSMGALGMCTNILSRCLYGDGGDGDDTNGEHNLQGCYIEARTIGNRKT